MARSSKYYVIRNKRTREWLPYPRTGTSATAVEPTIDRPPRFFNHEKNALRALKWWLTGRVRHTYSDWGDVDEQIYLRPDRIAEDWIVEIAFVAMES